MSKHTPGPWTVTHEDDFDGLVIEAAGREGEYVPVACVPVDYDDRLEREANAALIVRAPEMAAEIERLTARVEELDNALSGVLWMAEEWFKHGGDETAFSDDHAASLEAARAELEGE